MQNQAWLSKKTTENKLWFWLGLALLVLSSCYNQAWSSEKEQDKPETLAVLQFDTQKLDEYLVLNFVADLNLAPKIIEALENKIPIYLSTEIDLQRKDNLLFFSYYTSQKYYQYTTLVSYSPFDNSYKLFNLRNNNQLEFSSLADTLQTLGNLNNFYVIKRNELYPGIDYLLRVKISLDKRKLPASLYTQTFFNRDWDFKTNWQSLELPAER